MRRSKFLRFSMAALPLLAAACGSSGGPVVSAPVPPPPQPPRPNDTSVELLASPATQEFAVVTTDSPLRVRYDAATQRYQVKAGALDWADLIDSPGDSEGPNIHFRIAGQPEDAGWVTATMHHRYPSSSDKFRYRYTNMLSWTAEGSRKEWNNYAAVGVPTPASGVPLSGSASFEGRAKGTANVPNGGWGDSATTPLDGEVALDFDFAAATLSGSLELWESCDCTRKLTVGPVELVDTSFVKGSQTFAGAFLSNAAGKNSFEGRFTGPNAEELMATWALPFMFEGDAFQASGVWIGKR